MASTRRRSKAETRDLLLNATLNVLHRGGESAISSVSITAEAGVAQSLFYQHFTNLEECVAEASEKITNEIREAVALHRHHMYETTSGEGVALEKSFQDMFELVEKQRPLMQLFLRHRSDPLALNGVMYRFSQGLSIDLADQLMTRFSNLGIQKLPEGWVEALAEDLVAISLSAIERYLEGRGPSVEDACRLLTISSTAQVRGLLESSNPNA